MRSARLSPEESSAIAVVYTMFLAYVVFRDAKLTAKAFAYMMTELRIPAMITEVLLSVTSNKYVLMLIINILLLLVTYIPEISLWLPRLTGYAG